MHFKMPITRQGTKAIYFWARNANASRTNCKCKLPAKKIFQNVNQIEFEVFLGVYRFERSHGVISRETKRISRKTTAQFEKQISLAGIMFCENNFIFGFSFSEERNKN